MEERPTVTIRDDLLTAAGRLRHHRPETARRVGRHLRAVALPTGGFPNRADQADLYYTVFGLQALAAVEPSSFGLAASDAPPPLPSPSEAAGPSDPVRASIVRPTQAYLAAFGAGNDLDFVHLCCLARCRALVHECLPSRTGQTAQQAPDEERAQAPFSAHAAARLATFRTADGGFSHVPAASHGTAYGAFLAVGAYEDLGVPLPDADALLRAFASLRTRDGGYANVPGADAGSVPATAAALVTLTDLGGTADPSAVDWLLRQMRPEGGWPATPGAPSADLLSTAIALHALAAVGTALDTIRPSCLPFVETLALDDAGPPPRTRFRGHPDDPAADCEYTFYGLLALGHLLG